MSLEPLEDQKLLPPSTQPNIGPSVEPINPEPMWTLNLASKNLEVRIVAQAHSMQGLSYDVITSTSHGCQMSTKGLIVQANVLSE